MSGAASKRLLSRKERELQFRVGIVLDAAEAVFAESSYATCSVEEIAKRAELSVGTLYNLFDSKEEIYTRVISRVQTRFFDIMTGRVNEARGPAEKVRTAVVCHFEHFGRYIHHWRLYVSASNGFQWELKSKLSEEANSSQAEFIKRLAEICQLGMDEGVFKAGVPADLVALALMAVPHSFLVKLLSDETSDPMAELPAAIRLAERLVGIDED